MGTDMLRTMPVNCLLGGFKISAATVTGRSGGDGHSLFMIDAPALVDEDLRREDAGERGGVNGLPQDLKYLQHMPAEQVASGYLLRFRLCSSDY
jgi:hypothetical protein